MSNENHKVEVRDLRHGEWLWTHKAVLFSLHISASDFKVYCGLASYAGNIDQKSWPSLITLARELNLSKSTVVRSLRVLEACKLISIDRRDGTSNLYSLLKCEKVQPPVVTKQQSAHHRLVNFFHVTAQKTRNIKPLWTSKDTMRLKKVMSLCILSEDQLEQLMLYFLASPRFKKFSPSMAVFFSSGIFNGLMNGMQNDRNFWKDLNSYLDRYVKTEKHVVDIKVGDIQKLLVQLQEKMSVRSYGQEHVDHE